MSELYNWRRPFIAFSTLGGLLISGACSSTTVGGVYTAESSVQCVDSTNILRLTDGETIAIGVQDLSFSDGRIRDETRVSFNESTQSLGFDLTSDDTAINVDGNSTKSELNVSLSPDDEAEGMLTEQNSVTKFSARLIPPRSPSEEGFDAELVLTPQC